jgi:aldehyde dehydrogenase (NAD+)
LADPEIYDAFVARLQHWLEHFMKEEEERPWLAHIISPGHYARIHAILSSTKGKTITTGPHDSTRNFIHPTIISDVTLDDPIITSGELFAPLMPVIRADLPTALATLALGSDMADPLALYIFSTSQPEIDRILGQTSSGGVSINDLGVHYGVPGAPFGGVGESGHGAYHGKWGFDAYSKCCTGPCQPILAQSEHVTD